MIVNIETAFGCDGFLPAFDFFVVKLFHPSALHANQVVMVAPLVKLVHRLVALEVVAGQ